MEVVVSRFDEDSVRHLPGAAQAAAAGRGKALEVAGRYPGRHVLGADTVVWDGEAALGKPQDAADAARMLARLAGREHTVFSAAYLVTPSGDVQEVVAEARVAIDALTAAEVAAYVASGEAFDKAGAYAIQGLAGSFAHLRAGHRDTVIGLPTQALRPLLEAAGFRLSANLDQP